MPIDRSDIAQSKFFEQHAGHQQTLECFLDLVLNFGDFRSEPVHKALEFFVRGLIAGIGDDPVEIIRNSAHILGDAPLVIVQNDDQAFGGVLDVVEGLERDAIGQGRIPENNDHLLIRARAIAARRHAQAGRKRCAGVTGTKAIVGTFLPQREPHRPTGLADFMEYLPPPGQ